LSNNFDEAQDNLNKSIKSLFNALNTLPVRIDQNELFLSETKKMDVLHKKNISAVNINLEGDLRNE